jgi:hypothetical protein
MLRQKIGMPFGNVALPRLCQLDLTVQVGTRKPTNYASPFYIRSLDIMISDGEADLRFNTRMSLPQARAASCTATCTINRELGGQP